MEILHAPPSAAIPGVITTEARRGWVFRLQRSARAIAAGMRAAADFRRMDRMTASQLAGLGLTREALPRILFERHFVG